MTHAGKLRAHAPENKKRPGRARFAALFILAAFIALPARAQQKCPPATRTDNVKEDLHGVTVADPYRWLEDQQSPETRAWINAENACTESALRKLPGREGIEKRLAELMKVDSVDAPIARNGKYFFVKRGANQDLNVIYMRANADGKDEALIDPAPLSADHSVSVDLRKVSDDARLLVYGVRQGGEDEVTIHLLDTTTRKDLSDQFPRADYFEFVIRPDGKSLYYSRMTPDGPRIFAHAIGSDAAGDTEIFGKGYSRDKILAVDLSDDGRYLLFLVFYGAGTERSEVYVQDLRAGTPAVPIVNDVDAFFSGQIAGDKLYLLTNWKAPFWRVLAVDLKDPARDHWREIIPENQARLEDVQLAGHRLLAQYTRNAVSELKLFDPSGNPSGEIRLPTLGTVSDLRTRWSSGEVFFSFRSYAIPPTVLRYDVADKALTTWARPTVPLDSTRFEVKQVWFKSKDGTRVPMFLFHRKGLVLDGSNPTLLTGYGGFDLSETPAFREQAVLWAEHGGVWALANMRGGGEFGEAWHHAGMLGNKQNVFDDFFAAAEWLIANHYTKPSKLAIQGISNGGLLVGAALTQRPDLFQAVVCGYPLLDMVRYHKFLVARWWVPEYGSSDDAEQFKWLYAYSPYHHVNKGTNYPAVLFVTGDGDTRVAPLHARKMAAELQAAGSSRPVLLLYDTKSGHSGGRPLVKQIEETSDLLCFLFWQLGDSGE